jgi:hypothetical protein
MTGHEYTAGPARGAFKTLVRQAVALNSSVKSKRVKQPKS